MSRVVSLRKRTQVLVIPEPVIATKIWEFLLEVPKSKRLSNLRSCPRGHHGTHSGGCIESTRYVNCVGFCSRGERMTAILSRLRALTFGARRFRFHIAVV